MSQLSDITDPHLLQVMLDDIPMAEKTDDESTMVSVKTPVEVEEINRNSKMSRFIMTVWPPNTDQKWLLPQTYFDVDRISLWCGQFEECPETERLHAHLYVEFKNSHRIRFNSVRDAIERVTGKPGQIQAARCQSKAQRQGAVNYVLKPGHRMYDTEEYIWPRNRCKIAFQKDFAKEKQSKKSKKDVVDTQVDWIESKPKHWTWDQIVHESDESKKLLAACSWGAKFHAGRHASCERRTIQNVIVFYGAGGTGKTTLALDHDKREGEVKQERYYRRNADDGKFWGGGRTAYKGQRIIHLEEFCGQETAANFKEICDLEKEGPSVNIKNGGTDLNHETVIITSNHHPAAWYRKLFSEDHKQWTPICRRLTQVFFFPEKREDGELNIPDAEHPPFFIDQTADFTDRVMIQDYDAALAHAAKHWPIPERDEPIPFNPADHWNN
jgi:hypothetical protein